MRFAFFYCKKLFLFFALVSTSSIALADTATDSSTQSPSFDVQLHWKLHLIALGAGAGGLLLRSQISKPTWSAGTLPEGVDDLEIYDNFLRINRKNMGRSNEWRTYVGGAAGILGIGLAAFSSQNQCGECWEPAWRGVHYSLIAGEALLISWSYTDSVKRYAGRSRPYTYEDGFVSTQSGDALSFWSSHASTTAAPLFAIAHLYANTEEFSGPKMLAGYLLAAGVTTIVSYYRVKARKEFVSDVVAGGLFGTAVGIGTAALHLYWSEESTSDGPSGLSFLPTVGANEVGFSAVGAW